MGLILVGDVYFLNPSLYLLLFLSYSIRFTLLIFCFLGYLRKRNSPIKWYLVPPSPPLPTTRSLGSQEKVSVNSSTWEVFFFFFLFYVFVGLCTFEQVPIWWRIYLTLFFFHSKLCFFNFSMWTDTPIINFWLMWNFPLCEYIKIYLSIFKSMKLELVFNFLLLLMKLQRVFSCVPSHAQLIFPRRLRTWLSPSLLDGAMLISSVATLIYTLILNVQ